MPFQEKLNIVIERVKNGFIAEWNNPINGRLEKEYFDNEDTLFIEMKSQLKLVGR
jgi:hypothetical protein